VNTIVIIDDSFIQNISLNKELKKLHCNLVVVSNYNEALNYFDSHLIDLLIVTQTNIEKINIKDYTKFELFDILKKPYTVDELIIRIDLFLVKKQFKEFERNSYRDLLEQYKNTIDKTTIISKTDARGIITYVNDEFCSMSGYSKEELIGKSHNIIRHPDMQKSDFKVLWHTIKKLKQPWRGDVKNLKKDGSVYWVQAIICPMFDDDGEIIEYISVRTDITKQKTIVNNLENQLLITTSDFEDMMNLKEEYERAIDLSNILSRTDKNGKIIYVNEEFCRIFGYSKDEVIGQTHKIISTNELPKEFYTKLWGIITKGEIYKGLVKNKGKSGKIFWTNTTIVPIKDKNHEIIEYMAIKHDLTQVFELNHEIESTQREIVYKMGEIGESRSKETGNHVKRVAEYSRLLAVLYGIGEKEADILFTASPMHDIGKVAIPDSILNKPGKLTNEEFEIMKSHASIGYEVLKGSDREVLKAASIVSYEHHEKYNGTGYPRGLKGEEIHIFGRITAIADVFDALGHDRCYKQAWELDKILALFQEEKGKHFDPQLIDLFMDNLDKFLEIRDRLND
jgi:PAS domain S-box-containing protein